MARVCRCCTQTEIVGIVRAEGGSSRAWRPEEHDAISLASRSTSEVLRCTGSWKSFWRARRASRSPLGDRRIVTSTSLATPTEIAASGVCPFYYSLVCSGAVTLDSRSIFAMSRFRGALAEDQAIFRRLSLRTRDAGVGEELVSLVFPDRGLERA